MSAVARRPAQRLGTEYQAPSTRTSALRLTETVRTRRASKAAPGTGRSSPRSAAKRSHTRGAASRSTSRCSHAESAASESPRGIGVSQLRTDQDGAQRHHLTGRDLGVREGVSDCPHPLRDPVAEDSSLHGDGEAEEAASVVSTVFEVLIDL